VNPYRRQEDLRPVVCPACLSTGRASTSAYELRCNWLVCVHCEAPVATQEFLWHEFKQVNEGPVDSVTAAVAYFDCVDGFCFRPMPPEDYDAAPGAYWPVVLITIGVALLLWKWMGA
jgi:hypothetical protein